MKKIHCAGLAIVSKFGGGGDDSKNDQTLSFSYVEKIIAIKNELVNHLSLHTQ
jgi:hypothetical protein